MIKRNDGWLTAKVGDEAVMMSVDSGVYIGLNEVGARIWELIDQPCELDGLCAAIAEDFDITPEGCRPEVESFLADLEKRGAISRPA